MSQTILEYNTNVGTTVSWGSVFYAKIGTGYSYESNTATLGSSPAFPTVPHSSALISVTIGNIVTSFGGPSAFNGCSLLHTVTFSPTSTLQTIGDSAFYNCVALQSIAIPNSVQTIGNTAFNGCSLLHTVTISQTSSQLTSIGNFAFLECAALTSIIIPDLVQTIGPSAFRSCSSLHTVTFSLPSALTTISSSTFASSGLTSITIPVSVTSIGQNAFSSCSSLHTVTFSPGSTLITIGVQAFQGCSSLQSIIIPASITSIGNSAFGNCSLLATVIITPGSSSTLATIGYGTFGNCFSLISITIPDSVTSIGEAAFQYCNSLTSIIIPDSVQTIGDNAFDICSSLATVTISQTSSLLQTIGDLAFGYCTALKSITIPDSFQINGATIGLTAFQVSGLNSNGPSGAVTIDQQTINSLGIQVSGSTASHFFGATTVNLFVTCYEANTLILILENNEEVYKKVSKLKVGDLVKTYKQGYKKIKLLHSFKYKPPSGIKGLNMLYKHKENGVIITGGHSILVDELTEQEKINNLKQCGFNKTIEDKKLLLACSSDKFEKIDNGREYHLFHFSLETDDPKEHFGVYITDGILSESCPKDALLRMVSKRAIIKNVVRKMH